MLSIAFFISFIEFFSSRICLVLLHDFYLFIKFQILFMYCFPYFVELSFCVFLLLFGFFKTTVLKLNHKISCLWFWLLVNDYLLVMSCVFLILHLPWSFVSLLSYKKYQTSLHVFISSLQVGNSIHKSCYIWDFLWLCVDIPCSMLLAPSCGIIFKLLCLLWS